MFWTHVLKMGQCHIHDGCRYEISGPDGRMGNNGKCSVPTWRMCFSSGGVITTTLHYKKKYFFLLLEGLGAVGGGGGWGDFRSVRSDFKPSLYPGSAYFCVWSNPIHNSFSFLFNGWKSGSLARVWIDHSVLYLQWARCFGCVNVCGCNVKWRDVLWFGVPLSPIRLLFVWPSSSLPKLPKYCACGQLHC